MHGSTGQHCYGTPYVRPVRVWLSLVRVSVRGADGEEKGRVWSISGCVRRGIPVLSVPLMSDAQSMDGDDVDIDVGEVEMNREEKDGKMKRLYLPYLYSCAVPSVKVGTSR